MSVSKVKRSKQIERLKARRQAWDVKPLTEKTGKSGRYSFTRPGSNKK